MSMRPLTATHGAHQHSVTTIERTQAHHHPFFVVVHVIPIGRMSRAEPYIFARFKIIHFKVAPVTRIEDPDVPINKRRLAVRAIISPIFTGKLVVVLDGSVEVKRTLCEATQMTRPILWVGAVRVSRWA